MNRFDIYFSGQVLPGADAAAVREAVGRMFKLEGAAIDRLFSGRPRRVKTNVDVDKAGRYRAAFRDVGALVVIVPAGQPAPETPVQAESAAPPAGQPSTLHLLPPNTGSLEDCQVAAEAPPPPDISGLDLAAPGTVLDESPAVQPAQYDLSAYSLSPPDSGSLEDCVAQKPARRIGDISHLALLKE